VHRELLEAFATAYPAAELHLPTYSDGEDCVEGRLTWSGAPVETYFEVVLNYTSLWSMDRSAVESLRDAMTPFVQKVC
jgi:hypothetical protein